MKNGRLHYDRVFPDSGGTNVSADDIPDGFASGNNNEESHRLYFTKDRQQAVDYCKKENKCAGIISYDRNTMGMLYFIIPKGAEPQLMSPKKTGHYYIPKPYL